eukprot:17383-Heterococcus_DN1.PRE.1
MFRGLQIAERGVLVEAELVDKGLACNSEYVYVKFTKAAAVRLALQRQAEHIHVSICFANSCNHALCCPCRIATPHAACTATATACVAIANAVPHALCTTALLPSPHSQLDIKQCSSRTAARVDAFGLWLSRGQSVKAMRHGLKKLLPLQMTVLHSDVIAARALQLRDPAGETPRDRYSDSPEVVLQALLRDAAVAQSGADAVHRQLLLLQLKARHWRGALVGATAEATAEAAAERDKEQLAVRAVLRLHCECSSLCSRRPHHGISMVACVQLQSSAADIFLELSCCDLHCGLSFTNAVVLCADAAEGVEVQDGHDTAANAH